MRSLLFSTFFIAATEGVLAQEMQPLSETAAEAAVPYPPARCAGLYQAMMEWVGIKRLGEDSWAAMDMARENLILSSAFLGVKETGNTIEQQVELTVRDVRNVADLYLDRIERSYASTGHAINEDTLIKSDLVFCKSIAETMQ